MAKPGLRRQHQLTELPTAGAVRQQQLTELQDRLGYTFHNPALLDAALTHPSYPELASPGAGTACRRGRLEYLGDKVLGLLVSQWLMDDCPEAHEGELTIRCAGVVSNEALAGISRGLRLDESLRAAPRMKMGDKGAADTLEAILGAVYLDSGRDMKTAAGFVDRHVLTAHGSAEGEEIPATAVPAELRDTIRSGDASSVQLQLKEGLEHAGEVLESIWRWHPNPSQRKAVMPLMDKVESLGNSASIEHFAVVQHFTQPELHAVCKALALVEALEPAGAVPDDLPIIHSLVELLEAALQPPTGLQIAEPPSPAAKDDTGQGMMIGRLRAKQQRPLNVLIVGASSGIGALLAKRLSLRGAHISLCLVGRRAALIGEVAEGCRSSGASVRAIVADASKETDCARMCAEYAGTLLSQEALPVVVCNAGVGAPGDINTVSPSSFDAVMDTNVKSVWLT